MAPLLVTEDFDLGCLFLYTQIGSLSTLLQALTGKRHHRLPAGDSSFKRWRD